MWIYYSISLLIVLLGADQGLKAMVATRVATFSSRSLIPGILSITNVKNTGAAWSLLSGQRGFFVVIGVAALAIAGYYLWKCRFDFWYETAITLFAAGALGNLISRVVYGSVVDMFQTDFMNFPVFNLADTELTVGVALLMLLIGSNRELRNRTK